MVPKFVDAPDTPTLNLSFLCLHWISFTSIDHSLSFAIGMAKAAAKVKRVSTYTTNTGMPHLFVYRNAKLVSRNCIIASKVTWLYETGVPWVTIRELQQQPDDGHHSHRHQSWTPIIVQARTLPWTHSIVSCAIHWNKNTEAQQWPTH